MYEYTDKVIKYLNRRYIEMFSRLKSLTAFDELNILGAVNRLYEELDVIVRKMYLRIARNTYSEQSGSKPMEITEVWLAELLNRYDPVTKYVFTHEEDRKRARLAESLIASNTKAKEVDTALRYWSTMSTQYAIEVTDEANLKAMKDNGVKQVVWITEKDERRCKECEKREGQIYEINKIPPKPHIRCRCRLVPYRRAN